MAKKEENFNADDFIESFREDAMPTFHSVKKTNKHIVYVSGNGGILAEQYQHLLDLAAMLVASTPIPTIPKKPKSNSIHPNTLCRQLFVAYGDLATSLCDRCIFAVGYESADKFFFRRG